MSLSLGVIFGWSGEDKLPYTEKLHGEKTLINFQGLVPTCNVSAKAFRETFHHATLKDNLVQAICESENLICIDLRKFPAVQ